MSLLIISICMILLGIKAHSLFITITSPFQAGVIQSTQSKAKQSKAKTTLITANTAKKWDA
jgi:hypothetical protein